MKVVIVACLLLLPAVASAQTSDAGTIAGVVRDTSGAVLPGVTVEAASPVLIERVRTAVTDDQGLYRIVDLRPGAYTVTFSLSGFSTVRREALAVSSGFTATINADLRVGDIAETVVVTGESPVVDLQNVRQQTTLDRDTLDVLPTTGRVNHLAAIIPGATLASAATHSVGGLDERGQYGIHGSNPNDNAPIVAGMNQHLQQGAAFVFNNLAFQEVAIETQGMSADRSTGGVQMTIIPRDGGNRFSGTVRTAHTAPSWQAGNVDDALRARGLANTPAVKKHYDTGVAFGGPLRQDRLWFFGAARWQANQQYQQGNYFNALQGTLFYEPDLDRVSHSDDYFKTYDLRLTWQASQKHKIVASFGTQRNQFLFGLLETFGGPSAAPEAVGAHVYGPNSLPLVTWTFAASNKLLVEAGASANIFYNNTKRLPGVDSTTIQVTDQLRNYRYGSRATGTGHAGGYRVQFNEQYHEQVSVSYVTGSHNLKVGFNHDLYIEGKDGRANDWNQINQARSYTFRGRTPVSVTLWAVPFEAQQQGRDIATYVQDQWTMNRLTLNLGVRVNNLVGSVPATELPAGPWVPARSFPAVTNAPNYWNVNPRVGAAYDLFGNGKTAVKFSLGRFNPYGAAEGAAAPGAVNIPANNQAASTTRNWTDANGNYVPDCDLRNPVAQGECGPWSDLTFGQIRGTNTQRAADALEGFNRQFYNWRASASMQRELAPNVALNVGYHRTWYGGFLATDNLSVGPGDFDPYCVTAPTDSRLPEASGTQVCGLYDIKPASFGLVNNLVTLASHYGDQSRVYNGVDATVNARVAEGAQFSGGVSTGRTTTNECFVIDSPQQARPGFCEVTPPWAAETQVKFMVVYPLPYGLQTSAIYQNIPGLPTSASYVASNAEIQPTLGRALGSCRGQVPCTGTATLDLFPNRIHYEKRLQQIDLRFSRLFRFGSQGRVQGNLDVYNLFNANNVLNMTTRFGPAYLNAIQIMGGRLAKVSVQLDF